MCQFCELRSRKEVATSVPYKQHRESHTQGEHRGQGGEKDNSWKHWGHVISNRTVTFCKYIEGVDGYDESQRAEAHSIETKHETKIVYFFTSLFGKLKIYLSVV